MKTPHISRRAVAGLALVLAGFGAGSVIAVTGSASAATSSVGTVVSKLDPTKSMRSDEHLLTGTTAAKVRAAALAKYPGATVQRVESDSDGVYEAHVVTGGKDVIVQVGKDFTVTGTDTMGGGDGDGDGPDAGGTSSSQG